MVNASSQILLALCRISVACCWTRSLLLSSSYSVSFSCITQISPSWIASSSCLWRFCSTHRNTHTHAQLCYNNTTFGILKPQLRLSSYFQTDLPAGPSVHTTFPTTLRFLKTLSTPRLSVSRKHFPFNLSHFVLKTEAKKNSSYYLHYFGKSCKQMNDKTSSSGISTYCYIIFLSLQKHQGNLDQRVFIVLSYSFDLTIKHGVQPLVPHTPWWFPLRWPVTSAVCWSCRGSLWPPPELSEAHSSAWTVNAAMPLPAPGTPYEARPSRGHRIKLVTLTQEHNAYSQQHLPVWVKRRQHKQPWEVHWDKWGFL